MVTNLSDLPVTRRATRGCSAGRSAAAELDRFGVGGLVGLAAPDAADLEVGLADQHAVRAVVELLLVLEADPAADQHRQLDRLLDFIEALPRRRDRAPRP